jgi:hypothetical protein
VSDVYTYRRRKHYSPLDDLVIHLHCPACGASYSVQYVGLEESKLSNGDIPCTECDEVITNLSSIRYAYLVDFNYVLERKDNSKRECYLLDN